MYIKCFYIFYYRLKLLVHVLVLYQDFIKINVIIHCNCGISQLIFVLTKLLLNSPRNF